MKIYVLGNEDVETDNQAIAAAEKLKNFGGVEWMFIKPNEDLPPEKFLILMDTVVGLEEVTLLTEKDLEKLEFLKRATVHDYDLGFQLRYLVKLGKIKKVTIIGLPMGEVNYERVRSILRKLVAQDIQGS
jgi:hypothetical protein